MEDDDALLRASHAAWVLSPVTGARAACAARARPPARPPPRPAEELEGLLGPRPYRSAELRNIDKYKDGFGQGAAEAGAAAEEDDGGAVRAPPPPTDTPAGDLALAAEQVDAQQAGAGSSAAFSAAAAEAAQPAPERERPQGEAGEQAAQQKKRPPIVAT